MGEHTHTVQKGESLSKIARNYGVSLSELRSVNPQIVDINLIHPGDKVKIPLPIEDFKPAESIDRNQPPPLVIFRGRMSTFGGPDDVGMAPNEGLALVTEKNFGKVADFFLPVQPPGTTGFGRRLNPDKFYLACRWNYEETSKNELLDSYVEVISPQTNKVAMAKPIDWGPALWTNRVADLSPGLARHLSLDTDDEVEIRFSPKSPIIKPDLDEEVTVDTGEPPKNVFSEAQLKRHFGDFRYREDYIIMTT